MAMSNDVVDQIKKLLDVEGIIIITVKKEGEGRRVEAGTGVYGHHVIAVTHCMAQVIATLLENIQRVTEVSNKMEVIEDGH